MTLNLDRLRERYGRYTLYSHLLSVSLFSFLLAALSGFAADAYFGLPDFVLLVIFVPLMFGGIFLVKRDENALSSDEVITAILTQAIPNLQAFLDKKRERDRSLGVKNLSDLSREMEKWDFGTLELVEREIGKPAKRFRERFQKRLLPGVRTGDDEKVQRMLELLKAIYGGFMYGNYTTENFQRWGDALENLPDREVSVSLRRTLWLTPARRMMMILLSSVFAGAIVYALALGAQATPKEALTIATPVFAGVFAGLAIFAYVKPGTPS